MRVRILLVVAVALSAASAAVAALAGAPAAACVAGVAIVPIIAAWWTAGGRKGIAPDYATRLAREVGMGKRLALYDHDTGLLAQWYFTMRFAEECDRATRYSHSFSVILLQADHTIDLNEDLLLDWMRMNKRSTDLIGCLATGRYLMLLPDTDGAGAELALKRLRKDVNVAASIAEFPRDGASPEELREATVMRLPAQLRAA